MGLGVKLNVNHMKLPFYSGVSFQLLWNCFLRNDCCIYICCAASVLQVIPNLPTHNTAL
jgi:hypothetical protein